jgi:predicted negative regulator of RcsB-dependent stress response
MLRGKALALKGETAAARKAFVEAQQALEATIRELPDQAHHHEGSLALVLAALGQNDAALKTAPSRRPADA